MKRHLLALALLSAAPLAMTATAAVAQDHGYDHHDDAHHDQGHHGGWDKPYHRGDRLPDRYRGRQYYVTDYGRYHLHAPPSGYHWIRSDDGQFVLVAAATGLIIEEMAGH